MRDEQKKPIQPPFRIVCEKCNACIYKHYALTEGRCWKCRALLREEQFVDEGSGI